MGTNHGTVIVLNSISNFNLESSDSDSMSKNEHLKSTAVCPTGMNIKVKGQIVSISFLDMNGVLLTPVNSNMNQTSCSYRNQAKVIENEFNDLDIDFDYGAGMVSNSIADNFFGGGQSGGSVSSSNEVQANAETTSGSSSSSNTTPTQSSFVNPFGSGMDEDKADGKEAKMLNKTANKSELFFRINLEIWSKTFGAQVCLVHYKME